MKYLYILFTILFTAYGEIVIKWQLSKVDAFPQGLADKFLFLTKLILTNFYVFSGFAAAYIAALCWMTALSKIQLNVAYPFMSLSFVLVFLLSMLFFHEKATMLQIVGFTMIISGVALVGYSS